MFFWIWQKLEQRDADTKGRNNLIPGKTKVLERRSIPNLTRMNRRARLLAVGGRNGTAGLEVSSAIPHKSEILSPCGAAAETLGG